MESLIDTTIAPRIDKGFPLIGAFIESGRQDLLSNEAILNHFRLFKFIKETDTVYLNSATLSRCLIRHNGVLDSGHKRHSYEIRVTDEHFN